MARARIIRIAWGAPLLGLLVALPLTGVVASGLDTLGSPCGPRPAAESLPTGALAAARGDDLILVGGSSATVALNQPAGAGAHLRHVALDPERGVAFVVDRTGPDQLVVATRDGTEVVADEGEITHPAWGRGGSIAWARDMARIEVRDDSGSRTSVDAPDGALAVFSPVLEPGGGLVAIASEPVEGYHGEDEALNNLYRHDPATGSWEALTSFTASGDRWSILRTPVVMDDGSLRVVRLAGSASATGAPRSELWAVDQQGARRVRSFDPDTYLAGRLGDLLVMNVLEPETGEWRLVAESATGPVSVGCGSVMVDPLVVPDPDRGSASEKEIGGDVALPALSDGSLAIVIGDFGARAGAEEVAATIHDQNRVVGHGDAPGVVAPGKWAIVIPIPEGEPVLGSLEDFRERYPDLPRRTFISSP